MRRSLLISLALLVSLSFCTVAITGCGGGGGGGSETYSVSGGLWQMTSTDTATAIVGSRLAFRTNGTGYADIYGVRVYITWSQTGNTLVLNIPGEGAYAMTLDWNGPNEFTLTNRDGGHVTYVRVGNASVQMDRPESSGGETGNASRAAGLIGR